MKITRRASAFSLIEISIVILIIGILVAGVTQGSRLINQAKLNSAKTMTQSAPVSSIRNLVLWIESTSDASFQNSILDDGEGITAWNDINPQAVSKVNFTTTGSPKYKNNVINGLPAVCFNNANCGSGTVDSFTTSSFSNLTAGSTIFAVIRTPGTLAAQPIVSKRNKDVSYNTASSVNFQLNTASATATRKFWEYCDGKTQSTNNVTCNLTNSNLMSPSDAVATNNNYIVSVVYNASSSAYNTNTTSEGITFFQNGKRSTSGGMATDSSPAQIPEASSPLLIGRVSTNNSPADVYFKGFIGEIIIFDRAIRKEERQSIEAYLGKKWGIAMTVADF